MVGEHGFEYVGGGGGLVLRAADVPDEHLGVVSRRGNVVAKLSATVLRGRSPRHRVHKGVMAGEFLEGEGGEADVEYGDFVAVHHDRRYQFGVHAVPHQTHKRSLVLIIIEYIGVGEVSNIELSDGPVGAGGGEGEDSGGEGEVVDLLLVRYELRLDRLLRQVPQRARRVYAARAHCARVVHVPVKRRQWRRVLRFF